MSFDIDELYRREREGVHGDREPTMRELMQLKRHVDREGVCGVDHEPYDACMAFDRWATSWGDGGVGGRPARHRAPQPYERVVFQERLDRVAATDPELVDRCREMLAYRAQDWCLTHGYLPGSGSWETVPDGEFSTGIVLMRLTTEVTPRTDGEWPAIRQAIAEDEADRQLAETAEGRMAGSMDGAADALRTVSDRLDALRMAFSVWSHAQDPAAVRGALRASEGRDR